MIGRKVRFTKKNLEWEFSNDNWSCYRTATYADDVLYDANIKVALYQLLFPDEYSGTIVGYGGTSDTYLVKFNFGFTSFYEIKDLKFEPKEYRK